ncbi:hypothetical protein M2101_002096, partial [Parabacteroides sp. PM5-20]|nr:hypothetical protein [Parabacteroides sp. PM5-20]
VRYLGSSSWIRRGGPPAQPVVEQFDVLSCSLIYSYIE